MKQIARKAADTFARAACVESLIDRAIRHKIADAVVDAIAQVSAEGRQTDLAYLCAGCGPIDVVAPDGTCPYCGASSEDIAQRILPTSSPSAGRLPTTPEPGLGAQLCVECGHPKGLHYGPEGVCVADCRSLHPLIQCGCKDFVEGRHFH